MHKYTTDTLNSSFMFLSLSLRNLGLISNLLRLELLFSVANTLALFLGFMLDENVSRFADSEIHKCSPFQERCLGFPVESSVRFNSSALHERHTFA